MKIMYDQKVYEDLKSIDKTQAHMLIDYFETQYRNSQVINKKGRVFKTGPWRILFIQKQDSLQVLRVIR